MRNSRDPNRWQLNCSSELNFRATRKYLLLYRILSIHAPPVCFLPSASIPVVPEVSADRVSVLSGLIPERDNTNRLCRLHADPPDPCLSRETPRHSACLQEFSAALRHSGPEPAAPSPALLASCSAESCSKGPRLVAQKTDVPLHPAPHKDPPGARHSVRVRLHSALASAYLYPLPAECATRLFFPALSAPARGSLGIVLEQFAPLPDKPGMFG